MILEELKLLIGNKSDKYFYLSDTFFTECSGFPAPLIVTILHIQEALIRYLNNTRTRTTLDIFPIKVKVLENQNWANFKFRGRNFPHKNYIFFTKPEHIERRVTEEEVILYLLQ